MARIKEVLERGFTDLYDAFADMDGDRDGRVSLHDFHQALQGIDGSEDLTGDQIDAAFNKCKSDDNGLVVFKDFHAAFEGQARTANDAGEIASSIVPRAFEEVTSACCKAPARASSCSMRCSSIEDPICTRLPLLIMQPHTLGALLWRLRRCSWNAKMPRACKSLSRCLQTSAGRTSC